MIMKRISSLKRAADIKKIVAEHYEAHRQDRNYRQVWLKYVFPQFGVSYGICLEALATDTSALEDIMRRRLELEYRKLTDESEKRRKNRKNVK